jgi:hypothetical protein
MTVAIPEEINSFAGRRSHISQLERNVDYKVPANKSNVVYVDCYPLYDILLATGLTTVDVMFVDVEGAEIGVLETVPWDLVDIKVQESI